MTMNVYVTQGVHFNVPHLPVTVHTTLEGANKAAMRLTLAMLSDADMTPCKGSLWEKDIARLRRMYDDTDVDVWITTTVLTD
jgi:hypothetical protein